MAKYKTKGNKIMIKTIKFRNKKTGEIKTQISIMEMSQYEVLKTYRILNRKTNEWATVEETNFQDACSSQGWFIADCYLENRS